MKNFIFVTVLTVFFSCYTFSQQIIHKADLLKRITSEGIKEIQKSNATDWEGIENYDAFLPKINSSKANHLLINKQIKFCEEKGLDGNNVKTTITKTQLNSEFRLIEYLHQTWLGGAWVSDLKVSYTYNGNNHTGEEVSQKWSGGAWVNSEKYSNTYDGNNNQIESLYQEWNGITWVMWEKYSNKYDANNNLTESLDQEWNGVAFAPDMNI